MFKKAIYFFLVLILAGHLYFAKTLTDSVEGKDPVMVTIAEKTSLFGTVERFNEQNLMRPSIMYSFAVPVYAKLFRMKVHAGTYRFQPGTSNFQLIRSIFSGKNLYIVRITFPEGINLKQFASIFSRKLRIDSAEFMQACRKPELIKRLKLKTSSIEGYLMVGTFDFKFNTACQELVAQLAERQSKLWDSGPAKEAAAQSRTRHQILTMASIIQAEAVNDDEMPRISGVYWNRLQKGMLLQADPTVQYSIGEKRRVYYKDLRIDNPYNTYRYKGLPPGPINCPGEKAIRAALKPEKHDYLYFVAIGDGSNRHYFSRNSEEHNKYVQIYRQNTKD